MSVKKCAREECGKTVYPIEELKCLDKVWHKQCFKCTSCGMTLNMKNYKGYNKMPYCEPHYPKTVASVVIDTPEMRRLAENTKYQSQVQYHADYERMRGTKIEIADDPELMRHMQNSKVQSQAQYHGELEKKKQQDTNRPKEELVNEVPSSTAFPVQPSGNNENAQPQHNNQHSTPPMIKSSVSFQNSLSNVLNNGDANNSAQMSQSTFYSPRHMAPNWCNEDGMSPYSQRLSAQSGTIVYSSDMGGRVPAQDRQIGSIADYDPMNGNWGTAGGGGTGAANTKVKASTGQSEPSSTPTTKVGAGGSQKGSAKTSNTANATASAQPAAATQPPPGSARNKGFSVKALYDYTAADTDEVSFLENDIIVNCQKVDDGWMTGTVQRTLQWGMLPANYVERVNQPTGLFKLH